VVVSRARLFRSTIDQPSRLGRRIGLDGEARASGSILVLALQRGMVGDPSVHPGQSFKPQSRVSSRPQLLVEKRIGSEVSLCVLLDAPALLREHRVVQGAASEVFMALIEPDSTAHQQRNERDDNHPSSSSHPRKSHGQDPRQD
jgi:hypothetical protein